MERMSVLAFAACTPKTELREQLPFPLLDIEREAIPSLLRRRSSQATQLAFTVANSVCRQARRSPAELPCIFASVAGEIQTTDQLCVELSKADGVISPSAFHNSVQNTVAGYWTIAQQCTRAATALAAGHDTVAMALLEAWCQLACHGGEVLLVCYDEHWPGLLDPGRGQPPFACALLLAADATDDTIAQLGQPQVGQTAFAAEWRALAQQMPILAAAPLLQCLHASQAQTVSIATTLPGWQIAVTPSNYRRGAS